MREGVYLICPDLHYPFHCTRFRSIVLDAIRLVKPNGFIQLGDFVDWWQLSTYDQNPARKDDIKSDLNKYARFLDDVEKCLTRGSDIHQLEGNHEDRLRRYSWRNSKNIACIVPSIPTLLNFEKRNKESGHVYHWHPHAVWDSLRIGNTVIHHGFYFDQNVAVNNLRRYRGVNFIQGHTHRVQYATNGEFFSASLGHGSHAKTTAHNPTPNDWAQSIGILTVDKHGRGSLELATVHNNSLRLWGRTLKG